MNNLLERFSKINVWARHDQRAPHKPLLILWALARLQRGETRLVDYREADEMLRGLLEDYGPPRRRLHPEMPFWRLQNDGLWEIPQADICKETTGQDKWRERGVSPKVLKQCGAHGGFTPEVYARLKENSDLVNQVAANIMAAHFPQSIHDEILDAVGMPWVVTKSSRNRRDPEFRNRVLQGYEQRCAVCGLELRLGRATLGIEAAHVMWHAAGGPDTLENGVALCVLHHRALDRGAMGLTHDRRILVSRDVTGSSEATARLVQYAGRPLRCPQPGLPLIATPYIDWHLTQVFRKPNRPAA